ncbi:hypothetical protein N1F78_00175 [Seonamhaeicola sp. MEBiC1930]|uniref:hypothetical protein n=1 Tax=Seonamhaeicola sp. MEBiC01930 TaxID=2976768 RepID=UPI0032475B70
MNYNYQIEGLKSEASEKDSIKLFKLGSLLTDEEIHIRISAAFNQLYSDKDINDLYSFLQTEAFKKFITSGEMDEMLKSKFIDIDNQIESIRKDIINQQKKTEPINMIN